MQIFYHQPCVSTLIPLSNAPGYQAVKTKSNIQLRQKIRSENDAPASKENYRRLSVRRPTINPAQNLCYRPGSCFAELKPNPTSKLRPWREIRSGFNINEMCFTTLNKKKVYESCVLHFPDANLSRSWGAMVIGTPLNNAHKG